MQSLTDRPAIERHDLSNFRRLNVIVDEALVRDWGAVLHHRDSTLRQLRDRLSRAVYFATPRAHGSCSIRGQGAATVGTLLVLVRIAAGRCRSPLSSQRTHMGTAGCYLGDSGKNASGSSCAEVARNLLRAGGGHSAFEADTLGPGASYRRPS